MDIIICELLTKVLGPDLSEDLTQYISAIDSASDFEEYMRLMLDFSVKEQRKLYEDINALKFGGQKVNKTKTKATNNDSSSKKVEAELPLPVDKKKKVKTFSKFQIHELSQGYLREGRIPCECQARKHELINNCTECGRIVCEQEGSGPCFFCDNMVCTPEELEVLNSNTKSADALYRALTDRKKSDKWKKAMQHRNCLLDSDKNFVQSNKVIDDELDYFDVNSKWLSKGERDKATKKQKKIYDEKYGSRLAPKKYTLDITGKQMVEDTSASSIEEEDAEPVLAEDSDLEYSGPRVPDIESVLDSLKEMPDRVKRQTGGVIRKDEDPGCVILDKEFLEMVDYGMCLSMHQPWASLLMAGIKEHEGRTWYTHHRGTLWIHAASKTPAAEDIEKCKQFYTAYHKDATVEFPSEYPTGCLLGRVNVEDCMEQTEYRAEFPEGESESPFVFICENPKMLPVPLSMQGDHKIYKLKSDIFKQARNAFIIQRRMF